MDVLKRIEWLRQQITSQEKIRTKMNGEGNEIGAARATRQIRKYKEELRRLV